MLDLFSVRDAEGACAASGASGRAVARGITPVNVCPLQSQDNTASGSPGGCVSGLPNSEGQ